MDDETALRVEQVKLSYQTVESLTNLRARRHLAVLAVALAALVSTLAAALAGPLRTEAIVAPVGTLAAVCALQIRALQKLAEELALEGRRANHALERFILRQGEHHDDAPLH